MELQFQSQTLQGLKPLIQEIQNTEQTQELRLPDGMPDIRRVIGAWGQTILRGKQWHSDHISCTCGMQIWVLYEPEGERAPQTISSWIPFSLQWDLDADSAEGSIRISLVTRFVDARSTSPRKLMIRAGMGALAEAMVRTSWEVRTPQEQDSIPALIKNHTVRLWKEADEKSFLLDEDLIIPESVPQAKALVYCRMEPRIGDSRVLGDKLAFRGQGKLHLVYQDEEDRIHSWDFEIPFSQYANLSEVYGNDGECDIRLSVTSMEPELEENGRLRLKCAITGQYLVSDKSDFAVLEDAYHPDWDVNLQKEILVLPGVPNWERRTVSVQGKYSAVPDRISDLSFWPDFPRFEKDGGEQVLTMSGSFRMLFYEQEGKLSSVVTKWEDNAAMDTCVGAGMALLPQVEPAQASLEPDSVSMKVEMGLTGYHQLQQSVEMITEASLGNEKPQQEKPSLILMCCGRESLWEIAKKTGSRMEDIRQINSLEGECEQGMLLLIPLRQ